MDIKEKIKSKIDELTTLKANDLNEIAVKASRIAATIRAAEADMEAAAAVMDAKQYELSADTKRKAEIELSMYQDRERQIRDRKYITEEESDQTIDSILQYEQDIADQFRTDASQILDQLRALIDGYEADVNECETLINKWTSSVHPNYRRIGTFYPETGSNRGPSPYPVHLQPYTGSPYYAALKRAVDSVASWEARHE